MRMEDMDLEPDLVDFYNVLLLNLRKRGSIKNNSAFLTLISANQNTVVSIVKNSSIPPNTISSESLERMLEKKLIKKNDFENNYSLTARGIWSVEKSNGILNELNLIDYFNDTKFTMQFTLRKSEMDFREQITIFSMISARTFSKESCVNLQSKFNLKDYWKEIFELCSKKLVELDVVSESDRKKLYSRAIHEEPIPALFKRLPDIWKHTDNIYKYSFGNLQYWLEMPESDENFIVKLAWLFSLIFKEKLTYDNLDVIYDFCCEISYNHGAYVFNLETHPFSTPKYDKFLKDALIKCINDYT